MHRLICYDPPTLPEEMLEKEPKTGKIETKLGKVPGIYLRLHDLHFMVRTDYPMLHQQIEDNSLSFDLQVDSRLTCCLKIISHQNSRLRMLRSNWKDRKTKPESITIPVQNNIYLITKKLRSLHKPFTYAYRR